MSALDRFIGRAAPVSPAIPPGSEPCQACGSTATPTERRQVEGYELTVCVRPTPCREWAEATGRWKRMPS